VREGGEEWKGNQEGEMGAFHCAQQLNWP
jgi:hypothetical protein